MVYILNLLQVVVTDVEWREVAGNAVDTVGRSTDANNEVHEHDIRVEDTLVADNTIVDYSTHDDSHTCRDANCDCSCSPNRK